MATKKRSTRRTSTEASRSRDDVEAEVSSMRDGYASDDVADAGLGYDEIPGSAEEFDVGFWVARAQSTAKDLADLITREVQEHPVRTLAIAGAAGFLLASSTRTRILPALLKSGVGIAAAVALRQAAELGLDNLGLGNAPLQREAAE